MLLPRRSDGSAAPDEPVRAWPSTLATWGPGGKSKLHAHHCWHLILALDGELRVRTAARGSARAGAAVLTAPDAAHAIDAEGGRVLVVFVEPESELGDRLRAAADARACVVMDQGRAAPLRRMLLAQPLTRERVDASLPALLAAFGAQLPATARRHPGVRRVLRHLRNAPPESDTSLATLAALARLSPGRFMHAFTESTGVPLRPYLLWLKLERAGAAIAGGASLSEAAQAAGFADAAHMSRTFRRMFGVTPRDLQRRSQSIP
jgi:AraC-like DNA-binding protein